MQFEQQAQSSWARTQHGLAETSEAADQDLELEAKRVGKWIIPAAFACAFAKVCHPVERSDGCVGSLLQDAWPNCRRRPCRARTADAICRARAAMFTPTPAGWKPAHILVTSPRRTSPRRGRRTSPRRSSPSRRASQRSPERSLLRDYSVPFRTYAGSGGVSSIYVIFLCPALDTGKQYIMLLK
eukprot:SAG31_NODE_6295_length_2077_cov_121.336704_2_plen_184_part_00